MMTKKIEPLSKLEILKASADPLLVIDDIYEEVNTGKKIVPERINLLKWYGMYPHRTSDWHDATDYYMKRIKIVSGKLNLKQIETLADIGINKARNFVDFTTRQNIQLHYVTIKDLPEIFNALSSVGISSRLASGDCPRAITSCPLSGYEHDEIIDTTDIVRELNDFFDLNSTAFDNLPRKFKIGISGCQKHCVNHEIQDLAFTAFKEGDEVLFDLSIAGGLSKSQRIGVRAKRYVKKEEIIDVSAAVARIFNDFGNRHDRSRARVRHLYADWGIEKLVDTIEEYIGYKLTYGENEPKITPYEQRGHFGISKSKTSGKVNIGFATNGGRVGGSGLKSIHAILSRYGGEGIALTTTQNFIALNVPSDSVDELINEMRIAGFNASPSVFKARTQSCTGVDFCKFAVSETKDFASTLIKFLESEFSDFNEPLSISVAGCTHGCSQPTIVDIGLVGTKVKTENGRENGFEIYVGGHLEGSERSFFGNSTGIKETPENIKKIIASWIKEYISKKENFDSFSKYLRAKDFGLDSANQPL